MKSCGSWGKYCSWRTFQGSAINSARLSHQVQPALGSVTSYNAAEEATAMCPPHGDRLLGVTNTCQTCSRPKIEINNSCFALVPFTWGEPYTHRPACCSLPWPKHHLTDIPGSGKSTGQGTAHPERLPVTCTPCHTYGVRTKLMLGVGSLWSCWKQASSPCLLELEKCPSAGSTQLSESRAAWPDDRPGSLSKVDESQRGFLISRCF